MSATEDAFETVGAQRATLYVPTYESVLSLGAAYEPSSELRTQDGFSVTTTRHVFLRAAGSTTFQADGMVWFQAEEGSAYTVAGGGNAYFVAAQDAYLGAPSYCAIMAGYVGVPVDAEDGFEDLDPGAPSAAATIGDAFFAANIGWAVFDTIVSIQSVVQAYVTKIYLQKHKTLKGALLLGYQAGLLTSSIWTWCEDLEYKALYAFGEAGISIGTPGHCAIYGTAGTSFRSLNSTLCGWIAADLAAVGSLRLDTVWGQTSLHSATKVTIASAKKVNVYCTLGELSMRGLDISFGGITADKLNVPTTYVGFHGLREVSMEATLPFEGEIGTTSKFGKVQVAARTDAVWESLVNTEVKVTTVGTTYTLKATPSGIVIQANGQTVVSLEPGVITLGPAAAPIKVTPALADIGSGAIKLSPTAMITSAGVLELL